MWHASAPEARASVRAGARNVNTYIHICLHGQKPCMCVQNLRFIIVRASAYEARAVRASARASAFKVNAYIMHRFVSTIILHAHAAADLRPGELLMLK